MTNLVYEVLLNTSDFPYPADMCQDILPIQKHVIRQTLAYDRIYYLKRW